MIGSLWERHGRRQEPAQEPAEYVELPTVAEEPQQEQTAVASEEAAGQSSTAADTKPQGGVASREKPMRFSLHRSHSQLFVSSAETAAASVGLDAAVEEALLASAQPKRPRRKVRFVPGPIHTVQGLNEQPHQAQPAQPSQAPPLQLESPEEHEEADPAAAEASEQPSTEEEEEGQPMKPSQEQHPAVRKTDTFGTVEGASVADSMPDSLPGAVQNPASFELMAVSADLLPGPNATHKQEAIQPAEAADAVGEAEKAQESAAEETSEASMVAEHEASKQLEPALEALPSDMTEDCTESAAAEPEKQVPEQVPALAEPQQAAAEPALVTQIQEAIPGANVCQIALETHGRRAREEDSMCCRHNAFVHKEEYLALIAVYC